MSAQVAIIYPQYLENVLELTGGLPTPFMEWDNLWGYRAGMRVTRTVSQADRKVYICTKAPDAAGTAPESDATHWAVDTTKPTFWPWDAGTVYATVGEVVSYNKRIYSLNAAAPAGTPPTNTGYWTVSDRDYPHWVRGASYVANEDGTKTDRITYGNYIYACVKSGVATSALPPTKDCDKTIPAIAGYSWVRERLPNALLMSDGLNYSATKSYSSTLQFTIKPAKAVSAICLLGIDANSITVNITGAGFTTINKTTVLTGTTWDKIRDVDNQTVYYLEFAHTASLTITVTLTKTATSTPSCATVIVGAMQKIGTIDSGVQYGATVGTTDYTTATADQYGTLTVTKRPWAKDLTVTLPLPNELVAGTQELIAHLRGTPCLFRVTTSEDLANALTAYGFARDFSAVVRYTTESLVSLNIKGVI